MELAQNNLMIVNGEVFGYDKSAKALKELGQDLGRSFISLSVQEARNLAMELGSSTFPIGMKPADGLKLKSAIRADIMRLFPSIDDGALGAARIYALLESKNPKAAKAFWSAHKAGDREEMENVLMKRMVGVPRRINRKAHKAARTGPYGRVNGNAIPSALVNNRARENYIKKIQKRGGMAKAGWLAAAKGLGGRVRHGGGRSGGTRERFPAWVRKAGARRKLGRASVALSGSKVQITLTNSVRHIDDALLWTLQSNAENRAWLRFNNAMQKSMYFQSRKAQRRLKIS